MMRGLCLFWLLAGLLPAWQSTSAPPPPAEPSTARKTETPDPGRPVLRRGGPAREREQTPAPSRPQDNPAYRVLDVDSEGRAAPAVPERPITPEENLLERARAAAASYVESLPNFLVEQHVYRYKGEGLRPQWKKQDELQVEVMYIDRKEDYGNMRRNGRRLGKANPEETGTWSTGEFGSMLLMLLNGNPEAVFKPVEKSTELNGVAARIYEFTSPRTPGNWEIRIGRPVKPAFQGRIWIDPATARVLRIEMDSRQLPQGYAVDKVELTIDYDWVTIANQRHFLPVRSENLSCYSGTVTCMRNETFFRNYRRFGVESQVLQVESDISFEGEEGKKSKTIPPSLDPVKPPKPAKP